MLDAQAEPVILVGHSMGGIVISPSIQKMMYTALPCQIIISMETSHAPFFSAPEDLVTHLTSLESVSA